MPDPMSFIWSLVDAPEPFFPERTARWMLGSHFDRLSAIGYLVPAEHADTIACPACLDGHIEEVVVIGQPDGTQRFYIACPEYLRVEVSSAQLRRWTVSCDALADSVAKSLALGGVCTAMVDGRLWRLGRTKWQGTSRDVMFARGLGWDDGSTLAARIARCTRPIIFVGEQVPSLGIWPGRVPSVVAISQVATLSEHGLTVDHEAVLATILDVETLSSNTPAMPTAQAEIALMIRRQIKAEEKSKLTDDAYIMAYQQEGSVRKAAAFLSERTGQVVTKDKVQNALRRSGGEAAASAR